MPENSKVNWIKNKETLQRFLELGYSDEKIAEFFGTTKKAVDHIRSKWRLTRDKYPVKSDNLLIEAIKKENERLRSQLTREKHKTELILDTIKSSIARLPAPKIPPSKISQKEYKYDPECANLVLSDLHIGEKNTYRETAGLAEYNFDIFKKRWKKLISGVEKITSIHSRAYPITRLNILNLGDNITGETIYSNQPFYLDQDLMDQIFLGSQIVAEGIAYLAQIFPEVVLVGVPGNHGFAGKHNANRTNFDYIFLKLLQIQLKNIQNIRIIVSESSVCLLKIENSFILLAHGNEVRSYQKLPFYGLDRFVRRWTSLAGKRIDIVILGHHHRECQFDVAFGETMINGCFPGGSSLSVGKMQEAGIPKQKFFGIHPRQGKTWTYDIKLADMKDLIPDKNNIYTPIS